ncbi:hypothetical protein MmTuc01_2917 [Methanosarcina mazei Tuc01]|jgi:hypothetical protein|uniref:Uncharacterized protein n=1 Tax=Methanosarcina mazei Tuc01 TaxID=1236903 RepID=M1QMB6_METMZ|nr:hypothetical protein MmTuc01_2917 [Methanosarcina mazei Tuc01]
MIEKSGTFNEVHCNKYSVRPPERSEKDSGLKRRKSAEKERVL